MFGKMNTVPILDLRQAPEEGGGSLEMVVGRLLDLTEHPTIAKRVRFPRALFVFLVVPGDPEPGTFHIFDRRRRVWHWLDFGDEKFGGYTLSDFDQLVRKCWFPDVVQQRHFLESPTGWIIQPGTNPRQDCPPANRELISE